MPVGTRENYLPCSRLYKCRDGCFRRNTNEIMTVGLTYVTRILPTYFNQKYSNLHCWQDQTQVSRKVFLLKQAYLLPLLSFMHRHGTMQSFVYKITIVNTVQFNSFMNFEWSSNWSTIPGHIITLQPPCCLLLVRDTSELDKIHHLAHPSGPLNITQNSSMKITLEKSIFMFFLS